MARPRTPEPRSGDSEILTPPGSSDTREGKDFGGRASASRSAAAVSVDGLRSVLNRQNWLCVECHEVIRLGDEIAHSGERGLAHFGCIKTFYCPTVYDGDPA